MSVELPLVMSRWLPLSSRQRPEPAIEYDALHEGVPAWLGSSLFLWIQTQFHHFDDMGDEFWDKERLLELQRLFRLDLEWKKSRGGAQSVYFQLQELMGVNPDLMLDIVDYLLHAFAHGHHDEELQMVEVVLYQGGSAWRVGQTEEGRGCLERRVDETTTLAARSVIAHGGKVGAHLTLAWNEIYGRNPDPGKGYGEAVKAVEAAAQPVVTPKDSTATLGKMIAAMSDGSDKWAVTLNSEKVNGVEVVISMMKLLWTSQYDRHGSADQDSPISVTQEEAEAAIHLATTLVQWFTNGSITLASKV